MAAEYHWTARQVERELTDELLVLYLDEASDRITERVRSEFDASVEAIRAGWIFAHDNRQHDRWTQSRKRQPPLVGANLEAAVMNIARLFPDNISRVSA